MKVLIIIPAYNEAENILNTIKDLKTYSPDFDYIVINDCSTDATEQVLNQNSINHFTNENNLGIGGTVQKGYRYALENGYDIAIQFDGDGQHPAEYLHSLVNQLSIQSSDVVIGSRFIEKKGFQSSLQRRTGIMFLSWLIYIKAPKSNKTKILDVTSGMRATNIKAIRLYANNYSKDYPEPQAILLALKNNLKVSECPVIMKERAFGQSSITFFKAVSYMVKVSWRIITM